ncbi:hypothetical protein PLICRDRAFT_35108 [Plicaturopsis crispa FD-325 SS-3]|nr:hypothetical protein PLICRDRAFT_35108 [Plicaturopsis crispa FD-325 SS-3]
MRARSEHRVASSPVHQIDQTLFLSLSLLSTVGTTGMYRSLFTFAVLVGAAVAQTNLPPLKPGVFNVSTRAEIDASPDAAWAVAMNFSDYPNWNPFVRSQIICDEFFIPLKDQTPAANRRLLISIQAPPLPLPVNASTVPNLLNSQVSFENITYLDNDQKRGAWSQIFLPDIALKTDRWTAVSAGAGGNGSIYESILVFYGPLAPVVQGLFQTGLQEGFDAMGVAMKQKLEQ